MRHLTELDPSKIYINTGRAKSRDFETPVEILVLTITPYSDYPIK